MEITNLLDIHTREELYQWYLENHGKASDFWLRVNGPLQTCHDGKMLPGWDDYGKLKYNPTI